TIRSRAPRKRTATSAGWRVRAPFDRTGGVAPAPHRATLRPGGDVAARARAIARCAGVGPDSARRARRARGSGEPLPLRRTRDARARENALERRAAVSRGRHIVDLRRRAGARAQADRLGFHSHRRRPGGATPVPRERDRGSAAGVRARPAPERSRGRIAARAADPAGPLLVAAHERAREDDRPIAPHQRQDLADLLLLHLAQDAENGRVVHLLQDRRRLGGPHRGVHLGERHGDLVVGARGGARLEPLLDVLELLELLRDVALVALQALLARDELLLALREL